MSTLTGTGRLNPSRETKFSGAYEDRGIFIFLYSADHEQDWQPYQLNNLLNVITMDAYILCFATCIIRVEIELDEVSRQQYCRALINLL